MMITTSFGRNAGQAIALSVVAALLSSCPAAAAPQSGNDQSPVITVAGERCKCVLFYLCDASMTVNVALGSNEKGCTDGLVCCRVENNEGSSSSINIDTSTSESPPIIEQSTQSSTQPTNHNQNQQQQNNQNQQQNNQNQQQNNQNQNQQQNGSGSHSQNSNSNLECGVGLPPPSSYNDQSEDTKVRITGAQDKTLTYFGQFPWMIALLKVDINEGTRVDNVFQCGGSLIHPRVVLTAAHCVSGQELELMKVRAGEWDTQSSEGQIENFQLHQDRQILRSYVHAEHNNGSMYNDLALLELESPVVLDQYVNVICLPGNGKHLNYDPQSCVSTGWGKDDYGQKGRYQYTLKKVDLTMVPNDVCQKQLRTTRLGNFFRLHSSFVCASGARGTDVCKGDGGGPLVCAVKNSARSALKKYTQVGVVSWGIGCGDEQVPGVYSSTLANSEWLNKQLKTILANEYS
ncbi:phenoloxidase-activating factor 2-like [Adelges cooleyi]|uniref:phenoloxidase-activating factor 2-like n=1 Tax=Adelges cooleyi TaxID=133065 RepID=UPI00217FEB55|nr:phenoloxidase-activating factor 2-like [Adelges cooleyi]